MALRELLACSLLLYIGSDPLAAHAGEDLHGAGATFPAPLYEAWSARYASSTGIAVGYDAVGSGKGVELIRAGTVDFGASDAPLTVQELGASGLLQFPAVIGGVVPVINIRGVKPGELKFNGALLADIYLGRVRRWNDPAIAALNPTLSLPSANITVVHRNDPSGSSLLFDDYLAKSSRAWRASVKASLTPNWPIGVGAIGNEGVASYVQHTRFAIGYVEFYFAREHHLSDVALRNRSGNIVRAGGTGFSAAAVSWDTLDGIHQLATDAAGTDSWPMTGATFILVSRSAAARAKSRAVLNFFDWALHQGEPAMLQLGYSPLPPRVLEQLPQLWSSIRP
jgi:phosphate transport system substrate-binding protein